MNNLSPTRKKLSKVNILSLGLLILGIGVIIWSLVHILIQPNPTASIDNKPKSDKLPTLLIKETEQIKAEPIQIKSQSSNQSQDIILYPIRPEVGDTIGSLTIPVLEQEIPIIHGVGEDELEKGIGHFAQSVLPGENDNSVLSGHRDTVFRDLGKLQIGDQLIVQTSAGSFTYEINNTQIVDKDDQTIITPTDDAVLTVTTCYPFSYVGAAPDRYILSANLVQ